MTQYPEGKWIRILFPGNLPIKCEYKINKFVAIQEFKILPPMFPTGRYVAQGKGGTRKEGDLGFRRDGV